jgi:hypothetical protein
MSKLINVLGDAPKPPHVLVLEVLEADDECRRPPNFSRPHILSHEQ